MVVVAVRQFGVDHGSGTAGDDFEMPVEHLDARPHAVDADARGVAASPADEAATVVDDRELDALVVAVDRDIRAARPCVAMDVGDRFLDDAVDRGGAVARDTVDRTGDDQADFQPGAPENPETKTSSDALRPSSIRWGGCSR